MQLFELVRTATEVGRRTARRAKIAALAELLRNASEQEVALAVDYLSGQLPQGKLGLGFAAVSSVHSSPSEAPSLELLEVDQCFSELSTLRGKGSSAQRALTLSRLFSKATAPEQDFLRRLLLGELRQGALGGLMIDAVAKAFEIPVELVRRALLLEGELARVARTAQRSGAAGLAGATVQPLRPLAPMLADSVSDTAEALRLLGEAVFEYKLDGVRIQVHKQGEAVKLFTRNLNDVTARLPELAAWVRALASPSLILDGELLSLRADGRPEPFQVTMQRFGRHTAALPGGDSAAGALHPFFFDVLHVAGVDTLDLPLSERTRRLAQVVPDSHRVPQLVTSDVNASSTFFQAALAGGHEGLMAKSLTGGYEAGRRGSHWLKIKRAHTLDLVVIAAEWGSGRRRGWLSNLHLAARDGRTGDWVMLGKTFKGLSDELLAWQTTALLEREVERTGNVVRVRPELVVEIAFDGVQVSKQYPGGVALRFARVRAYRPDKLPEQADTVQAVLGLRADLEP